jgi:hypothetical protein
MTFRSQAAGRPRPDRLTQVVLPTRQSYSPSPADWREEVLYFLLVDRFSDGHEGSVGAEPVSDVDPTLATRGYECDPRTSEAMIGWAAINTITRHTARGHPATRQQRRRLTPAT